MKTSITLVVMFLISATVVGQETLTEEIMHNGRRREYRLFVPSGYSAETAVPFVLNLHGLTGNGLGQMNSSQMNVVAEEEGFLVAYPSAIGGDWFTPADQDLSFIDSLLSTIQTEYSVDESRVYTTGMSQGGIMSYMLGASRPDTFAAIASVTGTRPFESGNQYFPSRIPNVPARPLPMLHIHGTADFIVPFNGGGSIFGVDFPSVNHVVTEWSANNGCESSPTETDLPDLKNDNKTVKLFSYEACDTYVDGSGMERTADVLFYQVDGGGHSWPGNANDISASREVWDFFNKHAVAVASVSAFDFNADGALSVIDVDLLVANIVSVEPNAVFDLSGDGTVGKQDLTSWLSHAADQDGFGQPYSSGDSNLDGTVNALDLNNLALHWQQGVAKWSGGDFTADGRVNASDLNELALNWQRLIPLASSANASVPEPSAWILAIVGLSLIWRRTRCS